MTYNDIIDKLQTGQYDLSKTNGFKQYMIDLFFVVEQDFPSLDRKKFGAMYKYTSENTELSDIQIVMDLQRLVKLLKEVGITTLI